MTRSELIAILASRHPHLLQVDIDVATKTALDQMSQTLARGERIEIRGFGSFEIRHRAARMGRNPRTGESIALPSTYVAHFKPGAELRTRIR